MARRLVLLLLPLFGLACGGTKNFTFDAGPSSLATDAGPCDPYAQTGCQNGEKCSIQSDGGTLCDEAGDKKSYDSCGAYDDGGGPGDDTLCSAGAACLSLTFSGFQNGTRCYPFCQLDAGTADGGNPACGANAVCQKVGSLPEGFCQQESP